MILSKSGTALGPYSALPLAHSLDPPELHPCLQFLRMLLSLAWALLSSPLSCLQWASNVLCSILLSPLGVLSTLASAPQASPLFLLVSSFVLLAPLSVGFSLLCRMQHYSSDQEVAAPVL